MWLMFMLGLRHRKSASQLSPNLSLVVSIAWQFAQLFSAYSWGGNAAPQDGKSLPHRLDLAKGGRQTWQEIPAAHLRWL
jgi:hypothetical protein